MASHEIKKKKAPKLKVLPKASVLPEKKDDEKGRYSASEWLTNLHLVF
jgi:hypothetical protein